MNDTATLARRIDAHWDAEIVPELTEYIRVPAKSPHFDPSWEAHGHIERVIRAAERWVRAQDVRGLAVEIVRLPGRTPVLFFDVPRPAMPARGARCCCTGTSTSSPRWSAGTKATARGRRATRTASSTGAAARTTATRSTRRSRRSRRSMRKACRTRACVGVIETCEESGSYDLPAYLELLAPRMGDVDFVIGLDSGAGDYERLWLTTSLRGLVGGALSVEVLTEGVHSGDASGVVPSSFRIARKLLDRVEDSATGRVLPSAFHAPIPDERAAQARVASTILGEPMVRRFPWSGRTRPMVDDSPRSCSTARGARRCRSPAPTACRRSRTRATCCGRSRGSSCRSGCRRPSTARRPRTN
jgi:hypothetical protein